MIATEEGNGCNKACGQSMEFNFLNQQKDLIATNDSRDMERKLEEHDNQSKKDQERKGKCKDLIGMKLKAVQVEQCTLYQRNEWQSSGSKAEHKTHCPKTSKKPWFQQGKVQNKHEPAHGHLKPCGKKKKNGETTINDIHLPKTSRKRVVGPAWQPKEEIRLCGMLDATNGNKHIQISLPYHCKTQQYS